MAARWKGGVLACAFAVLHGQSGSGEAARAAPRAAPRVVPLQSVAKRPFAVGERAEYNVRFAFFNAGSGSMEVAGIDTVRGRDAFKLVFVVQGGVNALVYRYRLRDTLISWADTARLVSLRYIHDKVERGKATYDRFEIFPDRLTYSENGKPEVPTVADALDEVSFMYFVRTLSLTVGDTLVFPRYFKADRNPVRVVVLRKETIEVPAGKFRTIVVRPIFKARGMFSEGGNAELWLADDSTRAVVQLKSGLPVGTLTLQLRSYRASAPVVRPAGAPY